MVHQKLAVQLYTLRGECEKDFAGTMRALKQMGWAGVQLAGYYGQDPKALAKVLEELDLKVAGMHVSYDRIVQDWDNLAAEAKLFGTYDIVCPGIPAELQNEEGFRKIRQQLNKAAKKGMEQGLRVSYHNHAFEFETIIDGYSALEYMLDPTKDNHVLAEIDVYWVKKGGKNIMSFLEPYTQRMPIIHLKDMADDEEQSFAEIGVGTIDFMPILNWGTKNGIEWYVVEQDICKRSALACVQTSYTNLAELINRIDS